MEYTALYRKFRPKKFEEMVGQKHITKTLKNQIISGRIGHAYLFTGGRGTGKTSSAKIFARAINCLHSENGEPCNECEICKAMLQGSLTDVVEMDAASNNSVDDIRQIREEVNFLPTVAKYRIYIIDEVHMLSAGAFNALLKTLEEPPEHVKFILATTEPQKLPATILSRCQRFDFKKISSDDIKKRLKIICDEIKIQATDEALDLISILSEGAMRDAISIFERCIQEGNDITEEQIKDLIGIPQLTFIYKIVESIAEYDAENAIKIMQEVIQDGKDLNNYLWEIIKYIRDILVYKINGNLEIYNKEEINKIKELSEKLSKDRLLNLIYELSNLQNEMKWSSQKNILFQTGILKLCITTNTKGLEERVSALEEKLEKGYTIKNNSIENKNSKVEKAVTKKAEKKTSKVEITETEETQGNKEKLSNWNNVLDDLKKSGKMMIYANLLNTSAQIIDYKIIEIRFNNGMTPFGKEVLKKNENLLAIKNAITKQMGKEMQIKFVDKKTEVNNNTEKKTLGNLGIPINIIE